MPMNQRETTYRRSRVRIVFVVLMILLIAAALVGACTVFFRVEFVEVEGNAHYSREQILEAARVDMGENLILTQKDLIAQRLYDSLPYVDSVTVKKRFPTTLRLLITETAPAAAIATEDEMSWWLMDGKGKILEQIDAATAENYTRVLGLYAVEPQIGKPVNVGEGHITQLDGLLGLLKALQERGMTTQINSINASSRTELVMVYQGRIQAKLLNNVDFNRKILILEEILAVLGEDEWGVLDMKTDKNFYSPFG